MALSAGMELEVRSTGNDANGGGWNTASSGTDRSMSDTPFVTIDGATITAVVQATTTDVVLVGYTVVAADVGNLVQNTGGTGTVGFFEIISVNTGTNTWRYDKSAGTAAQTQVAKMGGGLKTIGKAGSVVIVAGNKIWIQYHASNVYTSSSTTANITDGRLSITVGSATAPTTVIGYDVTHGDETGNRPTIRWGVNAASTAIIGFTGIGLCINLIVDGNRANFTNPRGIGWTAIGGGAINCKVMGCVASAMITTGGTHLFYRCEVTDCTTAASLRVATSSQECVISECYFHDNAIDAVAIEVAVRLVMVRNIFDTNTGTHVTFNSASVTDGPFIFSNVFYAATSHAVNINANAAPGLFDGNLFEGNGGYAVNLSAAGTNPALFFRNNGFYNNTSGKYDTAKVRTFCVSGEVNNTTGTFFVNAGAGNFVLNNTAAQGLLAQITYTAPGGLTTNYNGIGYAGKVPVTASTPSFSYSG